jgi:hypothetical protein
MQISNALDRIDASLAVSRINYFDRANLLNKVTASSQAQIVARQYP